MLATLRAEYGTHALRLVTLLVIVSFAFIPVRCDASTAPHSIFVDPVVADSGMASHHHTDGQSANEMPAGHHHHHPGMHHDGGSSSTAAGTDPLQEICALTSTTSTDTSSQQPVGAALDLPTTPVPPASNDLLPLDGVPVVRATGPAIALTGITAPPEAPPPKAA